MASSTATRSATRNAQKAPRSSTRATPHRAPRAAAPATQKPVVQPEPEQPEAQSVQPAVQPAAAPESAQSGATIQQLESLLGQLMNQRAGSESSNKSEGIRAAGGASFRLDTGQLAGILTSRGRRAMRSVYHDDFLTAIANPGTYYGVMIEPPLKAAWIISQIRKAARECGLNTRQYSTYNRESEGFVSYVVHQPVTPPQAVRSGSEQDR